MKLILLLTIVGTMEISAATVYSQEAKINLKIKNVSIKELLKRIGEESKFSFWYSNNELNDAVKVSVKAHNQTIGRILDVALSKTDLDYQIKDKTIFIYKKTIPSLLIKKQNIQQYKISGTIVDKTTGEGLIGASITVKGTSIGTMTDGNGKFNLNLTETNVTLVVSYIGYNTEQITLNGQSEIVVKLSSDVKKLDEVVIMAFGKQKKANVTGAISTISSEDIISRPLSNVSNALIGTTTGISGLQTSGEPGRNAAQIYIRGMATYGNTQPLIVIDGIEQPAEQAYAELNGMDPTEISGISVLKDAASTAVYGIRGANGVIIVTTRRGNGGKPVFNLSVNYGSTHAINLLESASSYEWALMRNEAINIASSNLNNPSYNAYLFTDAELWKFQHNRDYTPEEVDEMSGLTAEQKTKLKNSPGLYYGNTDFEKKMFGNSAPQKKINLNISGGNDKIKYYTSLGYFTQDGIGANVSYSGDNTKSSFDRYNFRSNFDINVIKNTKISLNLAGQFGTTTGPGAKDNYGTTSPYDLAARYKVMDQLIIEDNPFSIPGIIDGKLVTGLAGIPGSAGNPLGLKNVGYNTGSPLSFILSSGIGTLTNTLIDNSIKINHSMDYLTKGLSIHATANYQNSYVKYIEQLYAMPSYTIQRDPVDPTKLDFFGGSYGANTFNPNAGYNSTWSKIYFDAGIDYNKTFEGNNLTALLLGKASQYRMPNDSYHTPSGVMGLVGRLTYNFRERYLLEYDLGLNGTEQFATGHRFGYFPAYSVGWVPTSETFFPQNKWITFLKIRASYGEVGNDLLGTTGRRYLYLPNTYNSNLNWQPGQGYYLGNSNGSVTNAYYSGAGEGTLGNPFITWERSKKVDIGFESRFFNEKLSFTADYFSEKRSNILTNSGIIPGTFGVAGSATPPVNIGKTENHGYELSLEWKDNLGKVGYMINLGLSDVRNKIIYQAEALHPYTWMNKTGYPIGQYYGLVSDGFFNTPEELANRPYNTYTSNVATLGDIRYKDINGDGKIDNKDIVPIGYTNLPEYHFHAKLAVNYKGFDLSTVLIGTANGSFYLNSGYVIPYQKVAGNLWKWEFDGHWTAAKAASGASIDFPRAILDGNSSSNSFLTSNFWLKSNNYIRIKNFELGYTLPDAGFIKFIKVSKMRVYFNADNLFTFKNALTKYGVDPETTDTGSAYLYPLTKVINFGLSMQF